MILQLLSTETHYELTARPKWHLDGPALSGYLLYSLVNPDAEIATTIT